MSNRYNFFYFEAEFKKYLIAGKAEESTVKNYLSDLHFFFSWLQSSYHITEIDLTEADTIFSASHMRAFTDYIASSSAAPQTAIRRLATLRKFFSFCIDQRWLRSNPALLVKKDDKNQDRQNILTAYQNYLGAHNYSKVDIDRHINIISNLIIN